MHQPLHAIPHAAPSCPFAPAKQNQTSLAAAALVLWRGWMLWMLVPLLLAGGAYGLSFLQETEYRAQASLLPKEPSRELDELISGFLPGAPFEVTLPNTSYPSEIMAFLQSRSLRASLLQDYDLLPQLYPGRTPERLPSIAWALDDEALEEVFSVEYNQNEEIILLFWSGTDPENCAAMLAAVVERLRLFLDREYVSIAQRRRAFVEEQLAQAEANLARWDKQTPGPAMGMERIRRELAAAEAVYAGLKRQAVLARMEEARELQRFSLLDPPHPPGKPVWPRPWLMAGLAWFAGLFGCCAVLLCMAGLRRCQDNAFHSSN